jgi:hypothetical protein
MRKYVTMIPPIIIVIDSTAKADIGLDRRNDIVLDHQHIIMMSATTSMTSMMDLIGMTSTRSRRRDRKRCL